MGILGDNKLAFKAGFWGAVIMAYCRQAAQLCTITTFSIDYLALVNRKILLIPLLLNCPYSVTARNIIDVRGSGSGRTFF